METTVLLLIYPLAPFEVCIVVRVLFIGKQINKIMYFTKKE